MRTRAACVPKIPATIRWNAPVVENGFTGICVQYTTLYIGECVTPKLSLIILRLLEGFEHAKVGGSV